LPPRRLLEALRAGRTSFVFGCRVARAVAMAHLPANMRALRQNAADPFFTVHEPFLGPRAASPNLASVCAHHLAPRRAAARLRELRAVRQRTVDAEAHGRVRVDREQRALPLLAHVLAPRLREAVEEDAVVGGWIERVQRGDRDLHPAEVREV